jgi:hypothetical protein
MIETDGPDNLKPAFPSEYIRLIEIETTEGIESFRWLATQLIQVATVLAIANITVLGYATSNNQAGLFVLGAAITFILLVAYGGGMLAAVPVLCRLISIEDTASSLINRHVETGISLTLLNLLGPKFLDDVRNINDISDLIEKQSAMRKLGKKMLFRLTTKMGTIILLLAILMQFLAVPLLLSVFHWKLF